MHSVVHDQKRLRQTYARFGAVCLLLIIPLKVLRVLSDDLAVMTLVGVAPSLLGPAGALYFLLASSDRLSRMSLFSATLIIGTASIALELLQLLPLPGFLSAIHYTFDPLDIAASLVGVTVASLVAWRISTEHRKE